MAAVTKTDALMSQTLAAEMIGETSQTQNGSSLPPLPSTEEGIGTRSALKKGLNTKPNEPTGGKKTPIPQNIKKGSKKAVNTETKNNKSISGKRGN